MVAHLPDFPQSLTVITGMPDHNPPRVVGYHMDGDKPLLCGCLESLVAPLSAKLESKQLTGKLGECEEIIPGIYGVSLGERKKHSFERSKKALMAAIKKLSWLPELVISSHSFTLKEDEPISAAQSLAVYALDALTPRVQLKQKEAPRANLTKLLWMTRIDDVAGIEEACRRATAIAYGMAVTRRLGDLPSNVCTPSFIGETAKALGEKFPSLEVTVLGLDEIKALGMGSFLSVAKGSVEPPRFIAIRYNGGQEGEAPLAFVGKGITFDTSGISLKPAANMWNMIFDMCGAASVMGVMAGVAKAEVKQNVLGVIATCENMPSGHASKPGDVVTSMSGKTIEVLNTDAEGRLILADALTWTLQQKPRCVVDMATLTGACVVALGSPYSGLFSEHEELAQQLLAAGKAGIDQAWHMPTGEAYLEMMQSPVADLANISSKPEGGACTAAAFLQAFTEDTPWAHLDIAATANDTAPVRRATGRPVPLLMHFVFSQAK